MLLNKCGTAEGYNSSGSHLERFHVLKLLTIQRIF